MEFAITLKILVTKVHGFSLTATKKFDFLKESKRPCGGCGGPINDRFLLKALGRFWHEDCLKCACCECRLGEVGSTLYTRANLILCKRDYLRYVSVRGAAQQARSRSQAVCKRLIYGKKVSSNICLSCKALYDWEIKVMFVII